MGGFRAAEPQHAPMYMVLAPVPVFAVGGLLVWLGLRVRKMARFSSSRNRRVLLGIVGGLWLVLGAATKVMGYW
jgi:hypothetical protein